SDALGWGRPTNVRSPEGAKQRQLAGITLMASASSASADGNGGKLAGRQGFEPRLNGSEPFVLPLDDLPAEGVEPVFLPQIAGAGQGEEKGLGIRGWGLGPEL